MAFVAFNSFQKLTTTKKQTIISTPVIISPITGLNANPFTNASGTYNFSYSSNFSGGPPQATFTTGAVSSTGTTRFSWSALGYGANPGTATHTIANGSIDISGEWIQVQLPFTTSVTQYAFSAWPNGNGINKSAIIQCSLLGSTNGSTWTIIDQQSGITPDGLLHTFLCLNQPNYSYLRYIVQRVNGNDAVYFQNIQIRGFKA